MRRRVGDQPEVLGLAAGSARRTRARRRSDPARRRQRARERQLEGARHPHDLEILLGGAARAQAVERGVDEALDVDGR